jgi:hypothetical protein
MKPKTQTMKGNLRQVAAKVGLAKCVPEKHRWVFFDSCPGLEILECAVCKLKRFVDTKTGQESFHHMT